MVDPATIALAHRALACPRWRWMPGMRTAVRPSRIKPSISIGGRRVTDDRPATADDLPDLDDPATVGCLEALIQAALGHDGVNIIVEPRWGVGVGYRVTRWTRSAIDSYQPMTIGGMGHATKAAALVAALEAAPR